MQKVVLVGRKNIYASQYRIHDDEGLRALDGILFGKVKEINDPIDPLSIWHDMKREFEKDHPDFHADRYSIRFEDGHEVDCNDKLTMHTPNLADENFKKLASLFPNAVTETIDPATGEVVRAIDKDVLMQEINTRVVEGREERYQFTWPDKKKAVLAANAPISAALRPVRADSVGRDGTPGGWDSENLYIEGDNLDVLKLLRETYLGKVKMIYIDPPYNTGNDFVYEDDFAENTDSYMARSGQYDEQGNQLVQNTDSNGRFHTDWLNMIYPRLRIAKDLLADDGFIFISIDDNEVDNLMKLANEVFGEENLVTAFVWKRRVPSALSSVNWSVDHEYVVCFRRSAKADFRGVNKTYENYSNPDNDPRGPWMADNLTVGMTSTQRPNQAYDLVDPSTGKVYPYNPNRVWAFIPESMEKMINENRIVFPEDTSKRPMQKRFMYELKKSTDPFSSLMIDKVGLNSEATKYLQKLFCGNFFNYAKPLSLIKELLFQATEGDSIILDFFSGSATTAHAVMQLNAEDGGRRKFIMVQLPEVCDEKSEAYKAGYRNICEIGKERIRRAGRKIKDEAGLTAQNLDIGFRVLRLDESNMLEVYYNPAALPQTLLDAVTDNIKPDRTPEDLLFQVMLELGVLPSSPISETVIAGKRVFDVAEGFLLACFDEGVTMETVTAIAKRQPYYAVFRDSGMASDSVATNFDQIFETYSPSTVRKVL